LFIFASVPDRTSIISSQVIQVESSGFQSVAEGFFA
jgi:hypothetical protein